MKKVSILLLIFALYAPLQAQYVIIDKVTTNSTEATLSFNSTDKRFVRNAIFNDGIVEVKAVTTHKAYTSPSIYW